MSENKEEEERRRERLRQEELKRNPTGKMKVMTLCHQAFCVVVLILMGLEFTGVITIPFWLFNGLVAVLLISTIIIWIDQRKKKVSGDEIL